MLSSACGPSSRSGPSFTPVEPLAKSLVIRPAKRAAVFAEVSDPAVSECDAGP